MMFYQMLISGMYNKMRRVSGSLKDEQLDEQSNKWLGSAKLAVLNVDCKIDKWHAAMGIGMDTG